MMKCLLFEFDPLIAPSTMKGPAHWRTGWRDSDFEGIITPSLEQLFTLKAIPYPHHENYEPIVLKDLYIDRYSTNPFMHPTGGIMHERSEIHFVQNLDRWSPTTDVLLIVEREDVRGCRPKWTMWLELTPQMPKAQPFPIYEIGNPRPFTPFPVDRKIDKSWDDIPEFSVDKSRGEPIE